MTLDRKDIDAIGDAVERGVSHALEHVDMDAIESAIERGVTASRNNMLQEVSGAFVRVVIGLGIVFLLWKYGLDILGFVLAIVLVAGKALHLWT